MTEAALQLLEKIKQLKDDPRHDQDEAGACADWCGTCEAMKELFEAYDVALKDW